MPVRPQRIWREPRRADRTRDRSAAVPEPGQAAARRRWQGGLRFVWNHTWAWCKAQPDLNDGSGKRPGKAAIQAHMVELKKLLETGWAAELPAHAVLALAEDLHRTMRNWFENRARAPKFRGKHQRQFSVFVVNQRTSYAGASVKVPKLGAVRYRAGDLPKGRLLSSRIYRSADKWFMHACSSAPRRN